MRMIINMMMMIIKMMMIMNMMILNIIMIVNMMIMMIMHLPVIDIGDDVSRLEKSRCRRVRLHS